jgi:hypothetical protein
LVCVKIAINPREVSEQNGKIFDFVGLDGKTVEEKV